MGDSVAPSKLPLPEIKRKKGSTIDFIYIVLLGT